MWSGMESTSILIRISLMSAERVDAGERRYQMICEFTWVRGRRIHHRESTNFLRLVQGVMGEMITSASNYVKTKKFLIRRTIFPIQRSIWRRYLWIEANIMIHLIVNERNGIGANPHTFPSVWTRRQHFLVGPFVQDCSKDQFAELSQTVYEIARTTITMARWWPARHGIWAMLWQFAWVMKLKVAQSMQMLFTTFNFETLARAWCLIYRWGRSLRSWRTASWFQIVNLLLAWADIECVLKSERIVSHNVQPLAEASMLLCVPSLAQIAIEKCDAEQGK